MEQNFEKATRLKLRFDSSQGQLAVEDLWDLSLQSLDTIAKKVNKQLMDEGEQSFIPSKNASRKSTNNDLKLEIVKHIIETKVSEAEDSKTKAENKSRLALYKELAEKKAFEKLESMSEDDLNKKIAELEAASV